MGQKETAVSGKNRIMIYGPKNDAKLFALRRCERNSLHP